MEKVLEVNTEIPQRIREILNTILKAIEEGYDVVKIIMSNKVINIKVDEVNAIKIDPYDDFRVIMNDKEYRFYWTHGTLDCEVDGDEYAIVDDY